jgi:hypothetical protein
MLDYFPGFGDKTALSGYLPGVKLENCRLLCGLKKSLRRGQTNTW